MDDIEKANRLKNLSNDPVFKELLDDLKAEQSDVFLRAGSSPNEREEAHAIIRALSRIDGLIMGAVNTVKMAERKSRGRDANGH